MNLNLLLITFLFSFNAFSKLSPDQAAKVNKKIISKNELLKNYEETRLFVTNGTITKQKVLTDLINREIGIQNAYKAKINNDPIVKKKMEDVLYHAYISKQLEGPLSKIKVDDKEVDTYYGSNPEYRTAHILFRLPLNPSKKLESEIQEKALKAYYQIKEKPSKFAELANQYTESTSSSVGGDLGFQPAARLAPEYFKAIKGKKVGYVTPLVKTTYGYHVIKILDVKKASQIDKNLYKKIIYDIKRDKIISAFFEKIRSKEKIEINKSVLK